MRAIISTACKKFNIKYKNKYLVNNFLYFDSYILYMYDLKKNIFYKAIVKEENVTIEQLIKCFETILIGE